MCQDKKLNLLPEPLNSAFKSYYLDTDKKSTKRKSKTQSTAKKRFCEDQSVCESNSINKLTLQSASNQLDEQNGTYFVQEKCDKKEPLEPNSFQNFNFGTDNFHQNQLNFSNQDHLNYQINPLFSDSSVDQYYSNSEGDKITEVDSIETVPRFVANIRERKR